MLDSWSPNSVCGIFPKLAIGGTSPHLAVVAFFNTSVWRTLPPGNPAQRDEQAKGFNAVLGLLVVSVVFPVVAVVVVISVAHVLSHLVQHQPYNVSAHTLQGGECGTHGVAVGLAGQGDDHYAVHSRGHLQGLREAQDRRSVDDDQVVVRGGFLQDMRETGADEVGGATAGEATWQNVEVGEFHEFD